MNISANDCKNIIHNERKKMKNEFVQLQLSQVEKKILIATKSGYDFVWYKLQNHFKYDIDDISFKMIRVLEKNKFYVRLFEDGLMQIIW